MAYGTVTTIWSPEMDEKLCDLMAEDRHSFADIAAMLHLSSRDAVWSRWRRLSVRLGYQAMWPTPDGPGVFRYGGSERTP